MYIFIQMDVRVHDHLCQREETEDDVMNAINFITKLTLKKGPSLLIKATRRLVFKLMACRGNIILCLS